MKAKAVASQELVLATRLADLAELAKPGITLMVVLTAALGFLLAEAAPVRLLLLFHTLVGTGLVAGGASALNHLVERESDARMRRTARRPLPAGRMDADTALLFGAALLVTGLGELAWAVNPLTALLGAGAVVGYVFVYTPLKRLTSLATVVGAVPGAIPPLMGWAAARGDLDLAAWTLFGILFCWQVPHFLAIAWLCRDDYARAGFPMLTVLDPRGRRTSQQMILYSAALLPLSLLPTVLGLAGGLYLSGALVSGLVYLGAAVAFALHRSLQAARWLLWASVLYLPAIFAFLLLERLAG